jgi:hypothetical protein
MPPGDRALEASRCQATTTWQVDSTGHAARTMSIGCCTALGVDYTVRSTPQRYDRDPRTVQRAEAAERWARHVLGIVENASAAKVVG